MKWVLYIDLFMCAHIPVVLWDNLVVKESMVGNVNWIVNFLCAEMWVRARGKLCNSWAVGFHSQVGGTASESVQKPLLDVLVIRQHLSGAEHWNCRKLLQNNHRFPEGQHWEKSESRNDDLGEWFGVFSQENMKSHVINPFRYLQFCCKERRICSPS